MTALNAITNDALLSIVEWGESTLRAPVGGETSHVLANVSNIDQIVIDTVGPLHTKVVANVATEMTQNEKDAVDDAGIVTAAALLSPDRLNSKHSVSNVVSAPSASGVVIYDYLDGNDFVTDVTENITSISIINPPGSGKAQSVSILFIQNNTVPYTLPGSWTGILWWESGAAPAMPAGLGKSLLVTIYTSGVGSAVGRAAAQP